MHTQDLSHDVPGEKWLLTCECSSFAQKTKFSVLLSNDRYHERKKTTF